MLEMEDLVEALRLCAGEKNRCLECPARRLSDCYEDVKIQAADTIERFYDIAHRLWVSIDVGRPEKELAEYSARHPEEGGVVEVLVMVRGATEPTVLLYDGENFTDTNGDTYKVDYWQPMPLPPKVVTG